MIAQVWKRRNASASRNSADRRAMIENDAFELRPLTLQRDCSALPVIDPSSSG